MPTAEPQPGTQSLVGARATGTRAPTPSASTTLQLGVVAAIVGVVTAALFGLFVMSLLGATRAGQATSGETEPGYTSAPTAARGTRYVCYPSAHPNAVILGEPRRGASSIGYVRKGRTVELLGPTSTSFAKVRATEGTGEGWIYSELLYPTPCN